MTEQESTLTLSHPVNSRGSQRGEGSHSNPPDFSRIPGSV